MKTRHFAASFLIPFMTVAIASAQEGGAPAPGPAFAAAPDFSAPSSSGPELSSSMDALRESIGTQVAGDTVVQYDPETDTIILITDEDTNAQVARVIEALDKPVPQVLIKVLFLEVTHSKDLDLGAEGSFNFDIDQNTENVVTNFGISSLTRGGFMSIVDERVQAQLYALATEGKLEVLSRPSVMARNNETATITIGQEVPFIRNSRITDNGQTINTVEYEDIGIILEVTPHITPDLTVEMEVSPEISTLTGDTVPISDTVNATVIAKRSADTLVAVENGKTVVIGGLMEDQDTVTDNKLPLLGDIPIIGRLFGRIQKGKSKTELLIFLTPYVVTNQGELSQIARDENSSLQLAPKAFDKKQLDRFIDGLGEATEQAEKDKKK